MTDWDATGTESPDEVAAQPSPAATAPAAEQVSRHGWDQVIDRYLIPWANGNVDIDPDLLPPTAQSIRTAVFIARALRDQGARPTGPSPA